MPRKTDNGFANGVSFYCRITFKLNGRFVIDLSETAKDWLKRNKVTVVQTDRLFGTINTKQK